MFEPQYTISDRLLNKLVELESVCTYMETKELASNVKTQLAIEAKVRDMFHLANSLGIQITLKDAQKLAEGRKLPMEEGRENLIANFRNILEFNRSTVAEDYVELDTTLMIHLNKIMLTNWKESWDVKFRVDAELDPNLDNWTGWRDESINGQAVQEEVRQLIDWFRTSGSRLNHVIRIGILVHRLVEIMPFVAGNKLTIIAITDFLLYRLGYSSKAYFSVMQAFDVGANEITGSWEASRKNFDLGSWLERFAELFAAEAKDVRSEAAKLKGEQEASNKQPFLDLNKRQLKILKYLQTIPTVQREDYCQMMDVSTMTAYRDLSDLVEKKLLKIDGQGRGTRYMLVSR